MQYFVTCTITVSVLAGYDPRQGRPILAAWMERVKRQTNPFYDEAHATLSRLNKEYANQRPQTMSKY